ncbi:hypothetical protein UYO_1022 [Lachnospiraceae bacterium JC7]|nr:hypothetical protein UYO_1022 [Lachnospiraceae bacterium JC7]
MITEIFQNLFTVGNLIFINIGMFIGIIFGAVPGMNGNLAITICLPFTFQLDSVAALLMLTSIYFGSMFGGSITAILIKTPGTGAATATLLDGAPMAEKGQPRRALDSALVASTFGGVVSAIALLVFAPQLGALAMKFGSPEYFILALFGLSVISSVSGDSKLKGLIAACLGVLLGTVGIDSVSGVPRFTFNNMTLFNGLKMMACMLGLFAIFRMLERIKRGAAGKTGKTAQELKSASADDRYSFSDFKRSIGTMSLGSVLGALVGAIPGTGGAVASYLTYNIAKNHAKPGEEFGKGEVKGIAAPESANNGATAASLIPMLTLGIPGSAVAATLMGAFQMHGLASGPKLFEDHTVAVYTILLGCLIAQFFMFLQGKYLMKIFVKITNVPFRLLTSSLIVICCAGAYAIANRSFDVKVMIIMGIAGYFLNKLELPMVPMVLGLILGPTAESYLRNSLSIDNGNWLIFFKRPICVVFMILLAVLLVALAQGEKKQKQREAESNKKDAAVA